MSVILILLQFSNRVTDMHLGSYNIYMDKKISNTYKDRYSELLIEVSEALKKREITQEQAELILGVVMGKKVNKFVQNFVERLGINEEGENHQGNSFMYIEYNKKLFH